MNGPKPAALLVLTATFLANACGGSDDVPANAADDATGGAAGSSGGTAGSGNGDSTGGNGGDAGGSTGGNGGDAGSAAGGTAGSGGTGGESTQPCSLDPDATLGTTQHKLGAFGGYTLFAPMMSTDTFLIDMCGRLVHEWAGTARPGASVYLLENGDLLRTEDTEDTTFDTGGSGGRVIRMNWDGEAQWSYEYSTAAHRQHHDVELLPNGNLLMVAWELRSRADATAAGRDVTGLPGNEIWPDTIIEVKPEGDSGGTIVWEWHAWDHLVQDFDATKANYGSVASSPELIDVNFGRTNKEDWLHLNGIDYNEGLDQILISVHSFHEVWVLDHSTSTAEAAGHSGGLSGKGGDILYRWGNPQAYGAGETTDQRLFGQHNPQWIDSGLEGAGNILVFNNGRNRPAGDYSTVDELVTPVSGNSYTLTPDSAYGPTEPTWTYQAPEPTDFYSRNISGAQRLPNGNTLICSGAKGTFFEVDASDEVLWNYVSPISAEKPVPGGGAGLVVNNVFRAIRYAPDFEGLSGRDLTPGDTLKASDD